MPAESIDLLGTYVRELAEEISKESARPAPELRNIQTYILREIAFTDWHRFKIKFDELHAAPDRRFSKRSFGPIVANEETAWSEWHYGGETINKGTINWVRIGTTNHSIKEIEAEYSRRRIDSPGLKSWIASTDESRIEGRRAVQEKTSISGKRYTRWTHDAPFVAIIEDGPAQACAIIRSQIHMPAFGIEDPMDGVLRAEIELMRVTQHGPLISFPHIAWHRSQKQEPPTSTLVLQQLLERSLPMLLVGAASDLLQNIYSTTVTATDEDQEFPSRLIPTVALTIHIPERLAGHEKDVAKAALMALGNPSADFLQHDDETARISSLTVSVLSDDQQAKRLSERQAEKDEVNSKQLQARVRKESVQPGDEYSIIRIDLPLISIAKDGRIYATQMYELKDELVAQVQLSPEKILKMVQANSGWLDQTSDYRHIEQWISQASWLLQDHDDWEFEEGKEFAIDCIRTALQLRGLQPRTGIEPPSIWLVMDTATLFPYAEVVSGEIDLDAFMRRATDHSSQQSMGAIPARIKVASQISQLHPELRSWATYNGVELVGPKSGFDAGSMHIKFWRKMVDSVVYRGVDRDQEDNRRAWWNGVRSISTDELTKAVAMKVSVHQDPKMSRLDENDFTRIGMYPYLDGIDSVMAKRFMEWRQARQPGSQSIAVERSSTVERPGQSC